MNKLFGLVIMATMLLFSSAGFASHAPPDQKAVSISCFDAPAIATIEAISFDAPVLDATGLVEVNCEILKPVELIAVDSGQGYKRINAYAEINIEKLRGKQTALKEGSAQIRRLSTCGNSNF